MAMVVKNNMSAVSTLNTLNRNQSALAKSLQKVSSGMKINSAQDDASGYAISERMRVMIRSLDQANDNTQNGSSLMKVAEGAVGKTVEILTTLKQKAINAATDTNTDEDRATIQKEIDQLVDQIDDNALVTFNGKYLLDGSKTQRAEYSTYSALTNQQLDESTDGTTKLVDLKTRKGELLLIQPEDELTASFVVNGHTFSTTYTIGSEGTLQDIFSKLNDEAAAKINADSELQKAFTKRVTNADGSISEELVTTFFGEANTASKTAETTTTSTDTNTVTSTSLTDTGVLEDLLAIAQGKKTANASLAAAINSSSLTTPNAARTALANAIAAVLGETKVQFSTTALAAANTPADSSAPAVSDVKIANSETTVIIDGLTISQSQYNVATALNELGNWDEEAVAKVVRGLSSIATAISGLDDIYSSATDSDTLIDAITTGITTNALNISNTGITGNIWNSTSSTFTTAATATGVTGIADTIANTVAEDESVVSAIKDFAIAYLADKIKYAEQDADKSIITAGIRTGDDFEYADLDKVLTLVQKSSKYSATGALYESAQAYAADTATSVETTAEALAEEIVSYLRKGTLAQINSAATADIDGLSIFYKTSGGEYTNLFGGTNTPLTASSDVASATANTKTVADLQDTEYGDALDSDNTIWDTAKENLTTLITAAINDNINGTNGVTAASNADAITTAIKTMFSSGGGSFVVSNTITSTEYAITLAAADAADGATAGLYVTEDTIDNYVRSMLASMVPEAESSSSTDDLNLVFSSNIVGRDASQALQKTANGEIGLTVTAYNAGVDYQISGLTINVKDGAGQNRKAVNEFLDAFKTTIFATNKSEDTTLKLHTGAASNQSISVSLEDMRAQALGLKSLNNEIVSVATVDQANAAIAVFDNALQKALDIQTTIGAIEARLEYTSSNLTTASENVQAAESTIRDADMAKEMTNYTKNNVLLQAAQSMLAQANQNSSAVLSLLQ